ncbi:unnamed protein product [Trichobilharzia szidati]|nr:unnamed protein product [Trichobilharzia szidati]
MLENNVDPANADIISKYLNPKASENPVDISDDPDIKDSENRDYFGFYHPNGLTKKERIVEDKYRKNDIRRVDKWLKMIHKWEEVDSLWNRMYRNGRASEKLTRRIFKGIPDRFRVTVWPLLLCVADAKNRNKDIYTKMLNQALSSSRSLNQIDLDINRTFRNTIYFRDRYGPRQCALFRVLAAYSVYNADVGYCQGMSELAGLFLIYIEDEEDAFWALNQLMTGYRHNMHSVYVADFPGLKRLFAHHERIVRKLLPILDKHFTKHDMLTSTYALKWYMQCFLDRLPVTLVLRLWDIYLLEGEKLLLAMAYNILKMHNKRLLRMDQMQMTSFFQDELAKDFLFDDDDVIDSLKDCLELLHKNKLDTPPPLTSDMLPKRLGVVYTPDQVWRNRNDTLTANSNTPTLTKQTITDYTPPIKPPLKDHSSYNGKLRSRVSPSHLPKTISVNPITSSSPMSLSSVLSKSSNYSPTLATSASIITAAAMKTGGGGRRYNISTSQFSPKFANNNPSYIYVSNQNMRMNQVLPSKSEIPYSPTYSSSSSGVLSSVGGGGYAPSAENRLRNASNIHSPSQTITTPTAAATTRRRGQSYRSSQDESYATTSGRHYRTPMKLPTSNSNDYKIIRRYELNNDNVMLVSVTPRKPTGEEEAEENSSVVPVMYKSYHPSNTSRFTRNKEISIHRQSAAYDDKVTRRPDLPSTLITKTTATPTPEMAKSRLGRWTSEQVVSYNTANRPASTTSSEISIEQQPWQKREASPSKYDHQSNTVTKSPILIPSRTSTIKNTSSYDAGINKLNDEKTAQQQPPLPPTTEIWIVGNTSVVAANHNMNQPNQRMNTAIYSPVSPDSSTGSQDTKYSNAAFTSSSSLSPNSKRVQIIRVTDDLDNTKKNNNNNSNSRRDPSGYRSGMTMKKPYYESMQPVNDYVRRIPSTPRSNIIMKPTEILMPEPKPVSKSVSKKLVTIQSSN